MAWPVLRFRPCRASLNKDLFLPGCTLGLVTRGSVSSSELPPVRLDTLRASVGLRILGALTMQPCSRPAIARRSGLEAEAVPAAGPHALLVSRKTQALCVARDGGTSSLAAPLN